LLDSLECHFLAEDSFFHLLYSKLGLSNEFSVGLECVGNELLSGACTEGLLVDCLSLFNKLVSLVESSHVISHELVDFVGHTHSLLDALSLIKLVN